MANVFDSADGAPPSKPESKPKRTKHREPLTAAELARGKKRLYDMVETAFLALEEAISNADYTNSIKAALGVLDRAGFGPKSTVDVNSTHRDLSELSREELAMRASRIAGQLRKELPSSSEQTSDLPVIDVEMVH